MSQEYHYITNKNKSEIWKHLTLAMQKKKIIIIMHEFAKVHQGEIIQ